MSVLGIDVGGKSVKFGVCEGDKICREGREKTPNRTQTLCALIEKIISENPTTSVGIGIPGLVRDETVLNAPNLKIRDLNLISALGSPENVVIMNDAEAAMYAEMKFGMARNFRYVALITIGTGIGGAVAIDGKLYTGNGGAAEFGHIKTNDTFTCNCGLKGCFETEASASALERVYRETTSRSLSAARIFELSDKGDLTAGRLVSSFIEKLGNGILSIANILRPERFILSGGISERGTLLSEPLNNYVKRHNYGYIGAPAFDIVSARFTSEAGIIGAAQYAKDKLSF